LVWVEPYAVSVNLVLSNSTFSLKSELGFSDASDRHFGLEVASSVPGYEVLRVSAQSGSTSVSRSMVMGVASQMATAEVRPCIVQGFRQCDNKH
jgi:hypothetical protein